VVIDRVRFDKHIAEQAKKAGTRIFLDSRITGIKNVNSKKKLRIKNARRKNARVTETDILVGADGPKSLVSRFIGNKKPNVWVGLQASVKMQAEKNTYDVYFGKDFPGFFGWVVPENDTTARVGIATTRNPKMVFNRFMKRFKKHRIVEMQGGLIPMYDPKVVVEQNDNYIVGDAATQVKATTGGGLVPGLKAAECLARAIQNRTGYKKELKSVDKELKMSLLLRKMLDRFNEADYNRLIKTVSSEKMNKLLNKHDRDRPSRIVFKSVIKEPKLLVFAQTLFRAKRL
ncbi:NAD(P)/FAD-dependent oxidoreductase, partial [Candidatus Woesearchaeota archaeon]|nr:NAD(P)/FAD-dependent oxidoreductase [Candidatus Woesearchaeota archaeon]